MTCDSLTAYLNDADPKIRSSAVEAIGKLQDATCVDRVAEMLADKDQEVRAAAIFALGQMGNSGREKPLIELLSTAQSTQMQASIIEALGKIGTEATFLALIKLFNSEKAELREATALASADLAMRGVTNVTMTKAMTLLLKDKEEEVRWKAAYALMRIGDGVDLPALRAATRDKDARVRMHAVTALGNLQDVGIIERLASILRNDPDWRVRVRTANALGSYPLSKTANQLTLLKQSNLHVKLAILQAIGISAQTQESFRQNSREHNLAKSELVQLLIQHEPGDSNGDLFDTEPEPPQWSDVEISAALVSYAQLLGLNAIDVCGKFISHPSERVRAASLQALGATGSTKVLPTLQKSYAGASPLIKSTILNAFNKIGYFRNPKLLLDALQEQDHVLVALAAKGLAQDSLRSKGYTAKIITAYEGLPKPIDPETAGMIFQALGKIGDEKAIPLLKQAIRTPDRALSGLAARALQQIDDQEPIEIARFTEPHSNFEYKEVIGLRGAKALIKTNRGNIEFDLFTEEAPLTVLNFVQLAEKGFYDRLTFHRVVPNFVIQGGDPRGDSWGSPGYAIRSEYNHHPYIRGTVGMASAGKDTEGCQFFITHSEQPQLTGKYTAFGQVTSGMDIVDTIQAGDVMELVQVRR